MAPGFWIQKGEPNGWRLASLCITNWQASVCYQKVSSLVKCNSNWSYIKNSNWSKTKKKGWRPHHIVECRYWPWIIIQQEWITNCIVRIFCHQHPHIGNNLHKNSKMENLNIICFWLMFVILWKMKTYHSAW